MMTAALVLAGAGPLRANDGQVGAGKTGSFKVQTAASITLKDAKRDKSLETLVRYPVGDGPFPVIVFSHGAMANKEAFTEASEYWSSHGYIIIHPNHADASAGMGNRRGGLQGARTAGPNAAAEAAPVTRPAADRGGALRSLLGGAGRIERIKDVTSVLDALDQVEAQIPALKGKINRDAIGVAGHSFGAFVAQCQGGAKVMIDGVLTDLSDPRIKAVVPISAQGVSSTFGLTEQSWDKAVTPALYITGTRDTGTPDKPGQPMQDVTWKKVPFESSPKGSKYLLVIEGANHLSFGGKLGHRAGGADAATLTKVVSLTFFDAYLKHNQDALSSLNGQGTADYVGKDGAFSKK